MASLYPVPPLKGQATSAKTHLFIFLVSPKGTMVGGGWQKKNTKENKKHIK